MNNYSSNFYVQLCTHKLFVQANLHWLNYNSLYPVAYAKRSGLLDPPVSHASRERFVYLAAILLLDLDRGSDRHRRVRVVALFTPKRQVIGTGDEGVVRR